MRILSGRLSSVLVVVEPRPAILCHLYCPAVWEIGIVSTDFWAAWTMHRKSVSLLHMVCWMWREWFLWRSWKHGHFLRDDLYIVARKPSSLALAPVDSTLDDQTSITHVSMLSYQPFHHPDSSLDKTSIWSPCSKLKQVLSSEWNA